ncbi:1753_t:CDS:2 [Dentiscutata erythropus]|uniref:1753_t:CDS:1 n=1 Tax=Dentiscutata erythropus TaxID=1348616 RepID=A0A9N8ZJ96_9GLOM|nr:1753_t:CDS:2 [Dentiscutata erythropus]
MPITYFIYIKRIILDEGVAKLKNRIDLLEIHMEDKINVD